MIDFKSLLVASIGSLAITGVSAQTAGASTSASAGAPAGASVSTPAGVQAPLAAVPPGWLVNAEEARQFRGEEGFNEPPALRARAMVPLIDIVRPEPVADLKVKAPFAIAVVFRGQADAAIDPKTFKVMYGAFKIDITNRLAAFMKVTKDGFTLDNANIPAGKHRLTLQVMDEKQRVAERDLRVEVE